MIATLIRVEKPAAGVMTFWFEPQRPMHYIAGQYTQLYLPHQGRDERGDKRWFTLSSSPTEPLVAITTKFAQPSRSSSFKQVLHSLRPGAQVHLAEPMGDFVLPKDPTTALIFAAAGMGVTPVRSMVKYLQDSGEARDLQVLYAAQDDAQMAFYDLFRAYAGPHFTPLAKQAGSGWTGGRGTLDTARILAAAKARPDAFVYLSGPEIMVERWNKELQGAGINPSRLVTDFFHGYPAI